MSNESAVAAYLAVFWPLLVIAAALSFARKDWSLLRIAAISAAGQICSEISRHFGPFEYDYICIYAASVLAAYIPPPSRILVVFAGVNLGGFVFSSVAIASQDSDAVWPGLFAIAVLELLVIAWGCWGGLLGKVVSRGVRGLHNLVARARSRSLG